MGWLVVIDLALMTIAMLVGVMVVVKLAVTHGSIASSRSGSPRHGDIERVASYSRTALRSAAVPRRLLLGL